MHENHKQTDVLVIGAGASGIPAAIAAARAGARVLVLEEDAVPGGAAVDQYVLMLDGGPRSGIFRELVTQLEQRYPLTNRPVDRWWNFWYLPSDYLRVVCDLMAAEPRLQLVCGARVNELTTTSAGARERITGATWRAPDGRERRVEARITIDATGTGCLAAAAGADARYGEDASTDFGEDIAPSTRSDDVQLCTWKYISQRLSDAAPFDFSRLTLSFPLESGYGWPRGDAEGVMKRNAGVYLHWGCRVRCRDTRDPVALAEAQREALEMMQPDMELLRANGYAVHLAPRLGVREQWRIVGDAVVTANELFRGTIPDDPVMLTQRGIDVWSEKVKSLGDFPETQPYGVPYRALIARGMDGLLVVGKSMSGTHLAMASYRVQSLLGVIGQAAGVAAALCVQQGISARDLDYGTLRAALTAPPQNVVLDAGYCVPP